MSAERSGAASMAMLALVTVRLYARREAAGTRAKRLVPAPAS